MNEHLDQLKEIRTLMERSSKFLSLSGLSGVSAGIIALFAAFLVYFKKEKIVHSGTVLNLFETSSADSSIDFKNYVLKVSLFTLITALLSGFYFTLNKAKKNNQHVWNNLSKALLINLSIPLLAGGLFILGMMNHGLLWLAPSATLVFYGLALINASKYTVRDVFYLGICEIILGILSMFLTGFTLLFWALGFGILHILYGTIMYYKYSLTQPQSLCYHFCFFGFFKEEEIIFMSFCKFF